MEGGGTCDVAFKSWELIKLWYVRTLGSPRWWLFGAEGMMFTYVAGSAFVSRSYI